MDMAEREGGSDSNKKISFRLRLALFICYVDREGARHCVKRQPTGRYSQPACLPLPQRPTATRPSRVSINGRSTEHSSSLSIISNSQLWDEDADGLLIATKEVVIIGKYRLKKTTSVIGVRGERRAQVAYHQSLSRFARFFRILMPQPALTDLMAQWQGVSGWVGFRRTVS